MNLCPGCGEELPLPAERRGRRRKWCSEKCRKSQYAGICEGCGAPTDGSNGRTAAPAICQGCFQGQNEKRNARILAAWNRWEPAWMIAAEEGLSETTVMGVIHHSRAKGENVILHRARNREMWPEVERLYHEGLTFPEIAEELGTSHHNIGVMVQAMREKGVDLPARGVWNRRTEDDWELLAEMWADGTPTAEIAESFGITTHTVYLYLYKLRKRGYEIPYRRPGRKKVAA